MIIVTGGAGFVGSNLVKGLNGIGRSDILVVDDLTDGSKFSNISDCQIMDYWDMELLEEFVSGKQKLSEPIDIIFHQGACSVTTEWNGKYMMNNNYEYSKKLLHYCIDHSISFIYASSGSVYGVNENFSEVRENEAPVNVYGYSKFLFDNYVRSHGINADSQVVGLRYFNVYGPGEAHKQSMASVVYHFNKQIIATGKVRLFKGSGRFADGEQRRDFIYVDDIVAANIWMMQQKSVSGIYNLGTGESRSFNDVAKAVIDWHGRGEIEYIDFPAQLQGAYQSYTQADISALKNAGYKNKFTRLEDGVKKYLDWLNN